MLKIGIVAPQLMKNHISYYESIISHFRNRGYSVYLFSHPWFAEKLKKQYSDVKFDPIRRKEWTFWYFRRIRKIAKSFSLVIVEQSYGVTASYIFGFWKIKPKTLYTVHNVNSWLAPKFTLSLKGFVTNITHQLIIHNSDGVIVVSPSLKQFIERLNLIKEKVVFSMPFRFVESAKHLKKESNPNRDKILLVAPGTINPNRRDYLTLLDAFESAMGRGILNIQIALLGKLSLEFEATKTILNKVQNINNIQPQSVLYWENFIPRTEFEDLINNADFLISNLKIYYPYSKNYEIYGITKEAGITALMCEHQKPCIALSNHVIPEELTSHTIFVESKTALESLITRISKKQVVTSSYTKNYHQSVANINAGIEREFARLENYISSNERQ